MANDDAEIFRDPMFSWAAYYAAQKKKKLAPAKRRGGTKKENPPPSKRRVGWGELEEERFSGDIDDLERDPESLEGFKLPTGKL